jgi:hypothetical protein
MVEDSHSDCDCWSLVCVLVRWHGGTSLVKTSLTPVTAIYLSQMSVIDVFVCCSLVYMVPADELAVSLVSLSQPRIHTSLLGTKCAMWTGSCDGRWS